ncbi:hypothetical protein E3P99_01593 [Wallemia hederae]|uniref:tRNA-5-taurinomethyluridine 2-sulfurtransferase n=1 Tax=Wallemia hederae TaxID=1540922 RepID=A0A4T0FS33_9BASI|nr:hypothetical protein E3P99_01593 [Wallemia hederae]
MLGRLGGAVRNTERNKRAIVGLSGGVDSSVAAALLCEYNYDVRAVFMRNWDTRDESSLSSLGGVKGCEWEADYEAARGVCQHLGIPSPQLIDLSREYWQQVFQPSLDVWEQGNTPNPDIACNRYIKFDALAKLVLKSSDDVLATGHYAQIRNGALHRAADRTKDQSYYLAGVCRDMLHNVMFPLGTLHKTHVRSLAHELSLPTAARSESMGICFIGERGNFGNWLNDYIHTTHGDFKTVDGATIAKHNGVHHYTIGQKARIGGMAKKWYVAGKQGSDVIIVDSPTHDLLKCKSIITKNDINWLVDKEQYVHAPFQATAQVRHRQQEVRCTVHVVNDTLNVTYLTHEMAVAPGQTCAIYIDDMCVASATIESVVSVSGERVS